MARKLASIQRISTVVPIKNADFIEEVTLDGLGWHLVAKKGEFVVGDLCIFFEIDSVLPPESWASFMEKTKYRVKTARLRGVLSQGLALPLSIMTAEQINEAFEERSPLDCVGKEVTEILGVTKYDPPPNVNLNANIEMAGAYPRALIPKTDETRLQSCLGVLEELKRIPWYATVKLDGSSTTYISLHTDYGDFEQGDMLVCSRNNIWRELEENPDRTKPLKKSAYFEAARKYDLKNLPQGYAIQGEMVGPGIMKNRLGLKEIDFFVFNVWDLRDQRYLDYREALDFCLDRGIPFVPSVGVCTFEDFVPFRSGKGLLSSILEVEYTLDWFLKLAEGKYEGTTNRREGIVVRPLTEGYSSTLEDRFSFKVLNNSFLLKDED